jgi:hypothetical protein
VGRCWLMVVREEALLADGCLLLGDAYKLVNPRWRREGLL